MPNPKKTISFECDPKLFESIKTASRNEKMSLEEYVARTFYEHFNPGAKHRRKREARRRFYCFEIDPD